MADSKRLVILKAITTQLETILVANGYQHDLVDRVFRGRADFGSETERPFVGLFEVRPQDDMNRADTSVQKDNWTIGVQGTVNADVNHPTDPAHNLLADIRKALGQIVKPDRPTDKNPLHMFQHVNQGLINDMLIDGGITFSPEDQQGIAVCILKLTIDLSEDLEDPYEI